jgi:hypothetical protein
MKRHADTCVRQGALPGIGRAGIAMAMVLVLLPGDRTVAQQGWEPVVRPPARRAPCNALRRATFHTRQRQALRQHR